MRQFVDARAARPASGWSRATTPRLAQAAPARTRHQGVVARVEPLAQANSLDDTARRASNGPAAAAGARRRDRPAQPRRLPARGRRRRRACGDRAEGPCGRHQRHGGQGGQRRGRDRAVLHGDQPGAHAERAEGARHLVIGTSDDAPQHALRRRPDAARSRWCSAPRARACASSRAKTCDELVRMPMHGAVESLNVSVASGVCLYEAVRQRRRIGGASTEDRHDRNRAPSARPPQGRPAARREPVDQELSRDHGRARPPAGLRGDRRLPARAGDGRGLERPGRGRADQRQEGDAWCRSCAPGSACSTACSTRSRTPRSASSASPATTSTLQPEPYVDRLAGALEARTAIDPRPDARHRRLDDLRRSIAAQVARRAPTSAPGAGGGAEGDRRARRRPTRTCAAGRRRSTATSTRNGYIMPGLGDAGDRIFGTR